MDFGDSQPTGIVWTIKFGDFLLQTGSVRNIDLGYCLLIRIARTIDLEGSLLIGIVRKTCPLIGIAHSIGLEGGLLIRIARTFDLGYRLLIGIARTIDLEGGLPIGIVGTIYFGDGLLIGIVRTIRFWRFSIDGNCPDHWLRRLPGQQSSMHFD